MLTNHRCEPSSVAILGRSRAGRALFAALLQAGSPVSLIPARRTLRSSSLPRPLVSAEVLVLALPDRFLSMAAAEIARRIPGARASVLHLSGALDHTVLLPFVPTGRSVASCHPIQTLRGETDAGSLFSGVTFGIEGQPPARRRAAALVRRLGGVSATVAPGTKALYHLAASLASNATVALAGLAEDLLRQTGFSQGSARRALAPLMRRSLENALEAGPRRALTGPVARGDLATLKRHRDALSAADPALVPLLDALVHLQRRLLEKGP
ncbi:MAG: DUF2520 domain-containing protein [Acidobacteria bacterium]|nr:DUF2520 domain-containing protein [Acidobacteriota bacterium]